VTRDDLTAYVYGRLPLRLRIAGRDTVGRIVDDAVRRWPAPVLRQCDVGEAEVVGSFLAKSLKRRQQQYGMGIILTLVLSALISEIVKILIRWWLDSRENRAAMQAMQETP
jgi:hypothetical protein